MEKPNTIEEAQYILEKKRVSRNIILKTFFKIPTKLIKLKDEPKEFLVGINEPYLRGLCSITQNNFNPISGSTRTVAYLSRAYFLRKKNTENRKYPNLTLKFLYLTKAVAGIECKEFLPKIDKIIENITNNALKVEDKNIVERDSEDFKELAQELKNGFEEYI